MTAVFHARAKEIFLEACELGEPERSTFLERACAGDEALHAAVNELLEGDAHPHSLLDQVELGAGALCLASGLAAEGGFGAGADDARLPGRIGRYRVIGLLGEGGMATVYEAEQDAPRRRVALKVMSTGLGSGSRQRRFERESELLGRLHHPGIAHVYESGIETSAGFARPFHAMELVRGRTLVEHARAKQLSVRERLELFALVCDAVQHAHQNGILHRDLKPANILVDEAGAPKVLDFGIALALSEHGQAPSGATAAGTLIGTLAYMSPEQVSAGVLELDTRSDIYSLGVVAYELLTGRLPYGELSANVAQAARMICEVEPVPLSRIEPALRGDLETILATALAKDRERRYSSAAEFSAELRRFLRDEPILARPASAIYQLRKFARRNRTLVAGLSLAALLLVAATILSTWLARREAREHARAERLAAAAGQSAYRANTLAAGLALSRNNPRYARELLATLDPTPGAWEYRRLQRLTTQWLEETRSGLNHVWEVAFDASGRSAILAGMDGGTESWNLETGERRTLLPPDNRRLGPRALSPDGARAVVARSGRLFLFDTASGEESDLPAPDGGPIAIAPHSSASFSADGRRLAFSAGTPQVLVFDLDSGSEPRVISLGDVPARMLALSADGSVIATLVSGEPAAWDANSGALLRRFGTVSEARSLAVDHDGSRIAVGDGSSVHVLELASGREARVLTGQSDEVTSLDFEPEGRRLAAVQDDGSMWIWDAETGELLHKFWVGHPSWRTSVAWRRDGAQILTGSHLGSIARLWDARQTLDPEVLRGHQSYVYPVRYTPDGSRLVSAGWDETVRLWSAATGEALAVLRGHHSWISGLAVSPDSTRIASVAHDGRLILWNAWTGEKLREVESSGVWDAIAWSPDGAWIAAGREGGSGQVDLLDPGSLEIRASLDAGGGDVTALAFSPDSTRLAAASWGAGVRILDLRARTPLAESTGAAHVRSLAWSPDGSLLAVAGDQGFLEILGAQHLEKLHTLTAHPREVFSAAFSRDGSRLFSAGRDGQLMVWDVGSGDLVGQFEGHKSYVWSLDTSPDGTRVATGSGDFTVRQWESQPVRETAERRAEAIRLEAQAAPVVAQLLADLGSAEKVVQHVRSDPGLSEAQRLAALLETLRQSAAR